jgi:RecB family endonuclease NucS
MNLGKLEKVELRSVWENEAQNFTPWLAQEENLAELSRTIGMELELVAQEQFVGPYRADIVCKDTLSQSYVLIENQLEKTNHNHLGQILTYAAGLSAKAVVWVASVVFCS